MVQDRLIVASRSNDPSIYQQTTLIEYRLPSDPFQAAPFSPLTIPPYGDADSSGSEFVMLQTGEVVSMTYQHTGMRVKSGQDQAAA